MFSRRKKIFLELVDSYTKNEVIVAFSGGVDSSLLLKTVCDVAASKKKRVHAVTVQTTLHPVAEIALTRGLAKDFGAVHKVVEIDELHHAGVMENPVNRCYLCKKYLFGKLREMAEKSQIEIIMDGTNADDLLVYRPGLQALEELKIISPLAEAGMTKDDVREMATEYGLTVASRPSAPCLATRFPYGTKLSYENMRKVEQGEEYLKSLGFYNLRLRIHEDIARIEVDANDIDNVVKYRDSIVAYLKDLGYAYITVDLEGFRSGSMDYNVNKQKL